MVSAPPCHTTPGAARPDQTRPVSQSASQHISRYSFLVFSSFFRFYFIIWNLVERDCWPLLPLLLLRLLLSLYILVPGLLRAMNNGHGGQWIQYEIFSCDVFSLVFLFGFSSNFTFIRCGLCTFVRYSESSADCGTRSRRNAESVSNSMFKYLNSFS